MLSEKDKQAIFNGTCGITSSGHKAMFVGTIATSYYKHLFTVEKDNGDIATCVYSDELRFCHVVSELDIVGLWDDRPEPFNLEKALAGKPFRNHLGLKTYLLADVRENAPKEIKPLVGYIVQSDGTLTTFNCNLSSLVGFTMWRD